MRFLFSFVAFILFNTDIFSNNTHEWNIDEHTPVRTRKTRPRSFDLQYERGSEKIQRCTTFSTDRKLYKQDVYERFLDWIDSRPSYLDSDAYSAMNEEEKIVFHKILKGGVNNKIPQKNKLPLAYSIFKKRYHLSVALIEQGADVYNCTKDRQNALHLALYHNFTRLVYYLLDRYSLAAQLDNKNRYPIFYMIQHQNTESFMRLITADSVPAESYNISTSEEYKHFSEKVLNNINMYISNQDVYGYSLLHYACWYGNHALVKQLLYLGADPSIVDKKGLTPLNLMLNNKDLDAQKKEKVKETFFYVKKQYGDDKQFIKPQCIRKCQDDIIYEKLSRQTAKALNLFGEPDGSF